MAAAATDTAVWSTPQGGDAVPGKHLCDYRNRLCEWTARYIFGATIIGDMVSTIADNTSMADNSLDTMASAASSTAAADTVASTGAAAVAAVAAAAPAPAIGMAAQAATAAALLALSNGLLQWLG